MRGLRWILSFVGFAALGAAVIGASLSREVTDIGLRTKTRRNTPAGWVQRDCPTGQMFRADFGELERVEFSLVRQGAGPGAGLVLELRDLEGVEPGSFSDAPVVRTAQWTPGPDTPRTCWATFSFEPIADSRGRTYHAALKPAGEASHSVWSPLMRPRGSLGRSHAWGVAVGGDPITVDFVQRGPLEAGPKLVYSGGLWAVAMAFARLHPEEGETALELYRLPRDGEEGEPQLVSRGSLGHQMPIRSGYGLFLLDPPSDLRLVPLRAVLTAPEGTVVPGKDNIPSVALFHGRGEPTPGLLGQTLGDQRLPHRDLHFRAFGEDGIGASWALLGRRGARWRYVWGLIFWAATMTAATALLTVAGRRAGDQRNQTKSRGA